MPFRFQDIPVARKLTLISVLTSGAALFLACALFVSYEQISGRQQMARDLTIIADMVGYNSAAALSFRDEASAEQTMKTLLEQPHIVAACIYDGNGRVFATFERDGTESWPWPRAQSEGRTQFGATALEVFRPLKIGDDLVGSFYIRSDLSPLIERLQRDAIIAGIVLLISASSAWLINSRLQRLISAPVAELASIVDVVAREKNYAVRAVKESHDEFGRLIDGFNAMLAQIQARDAELNRSRDELEQRVEDRTASLKVLQQQAAENAAELRFILEALPVGVSWAHYGQDRQSEIVNQCFFRISGISPDDGASTERLRAATHLDDLAKNDEILRRLRTGETDFESLEKRYVHADGRIVWVELTMKVYRGADGQVIQRISTLVDITERKAADESLRRQQQEIQTLFDLVPAFIYFKDTRNVTLRANRRWADLLGTSVNAIEGHPSHDLSSDPAHEAEIIRSGKPKFGIVEQMRRRDGESIWLETNKVPLIDAEGNVTGLAVLSQDITERKRTQEELEQTHKRLLDLSRRAGMAEVATGVLHNVGNVLNSVNVSAAVVVDELQRSRGANLAKVSALLHENAADIGRFMTEDPRGRAVPEYLALLHAQLAAERRTMATELEHLRKHIDHIKDIVAMQQSYAKVSGLIETVPICELVDDALRMNAGALSRHQLELVRDYQDRPVVSTERHKVLQILVNFIRNAKYACDAAGQEKKQVRVRVAEQNGRVRVSVIDNGIGIPAENLTRIFAHGFTTKSDGHGFGLHSGALAAKELGGAIIVESEGAGRGAAFTLELPLSPQLS